MTTTKKHPQFILAMAAAFFKQHGTFQQGMNVYSRDAFISEAQSFLVIAEREMLEKATPFRQLLPYIIIRQVGVDGVTRYIPYRRTSGVGESRLAGNVSVGYGGHIDLVDVVFNNKSVVDLWRTIYESMLREVVGEEIKVRDKIGAIDKGFLKQKISEIGFTELVDRFILDDTNDVGKVHVGLIGVLDVPSDWVVQCGEDELVTMPPMTADELLGSGLPLENWTRIFLEAEAVPAMLRQQAA